MENQAIKWLDLTFDSPAENLACDEALLELCEESGVEVLRCWESRQIFVVVGYGNRVASEVNVEESHRRGVPILRRCSGGGTVVQGPGCLNYNLTLRIPESGPLTTVTGTNDFVMERHRTALEKILGLSVSMQGHSDLAWREVASSELRVENQAGTSALTSHLSPFTPVCQWLKFSGNAQRRRRRALVFHGTLLFGFDLGLMDALLRFPSAQPGYRADRVHRDFVRNIPVAADDLRVALRAAWGAEEILPDAPLDRLGPLLRDHYLNENWNQRR